jgi:DNA-binding CsgD family transcriptional regulator
MTGQSARQAGQARPQAYGYALPSERYDLPCKILDRVAKRFEPIGAKPRTYRHVDRSRSASRISELEQELEVTRESLRSAIRDLAIANAGQAAIREEARCANEKFRSINCKLDKSKEELQSLQEDANHLSTCRQTAALQVATLTIRQRQILSLVLAGHPSKNIAADLGISQRTVDNHRAAIMRKTGSRSLPGLIRTALAAT